jgi:hypothetical protein
MLELNKKLDVEVEDFHGSTIYYIPDFYKDPDEIKEVLDLVEPKYFKEDQNGAYNRIHFHDMRHKIPCSNIGFVNKVQIFVNNIPMRKDLFKRTVISL